MNRDRARNLAVGLTVVVALAILGMMIILFAGVPQFLQGGYPIKIHFDSTHDAHTGDGIHLRGMQVGRLTDIEFTDGDPRKGVTLVGYVNGDVSLPGNTRAYIFSRGVTGGAYVELKPDGPPRIDPRTGREIEFLPRDGSVVFEGVAQGSELFPQDLKDELLKAMRNIGDLTSRLSDMLGPASPQGATAPGTGPATATAPAPTGLKGTLAKLDAALQAVSSVLGNEDNQKNLKASLANLAAATAKAADAMDALKDFAGQARKTVQDISQPAADTVRHFDEVAQKLIATADSISTTMASLNKVAIQTASGEGTAGKLLNDPKLYNDLVDTTRQLNNLIDDLRASLKEWKEKGIPLKVK